MEKSYDYKSSSIYYETYGNQKGETIVMLHPAFANLTIFKEQLAFFSEDYFIVAIDMIGHGKSTTGGGKVNMKDMPLIINNILDVEKRGQVHLLGVSLGSLLVQSIADIFLHRVKSVTVVGGYSIHRDNESILKAQQKEMSKWLFYLLFSLKRFKSHIVEASCYSDASKKVFCKALESFKRRQLMAMNGMNVLMTKKAEPLEYPLLIACGQHDLDLAKDFGKMWETGEPLGQYVEIPDAGHCANIDNPLVFNQVYSRFITAHT